MRALLHQLRMKTERGTHVLCRGSKFLIAWPRTWRGRHREREYLQAFAFGDSGGVIAIEIEMAVEIDKIGDHEVLKRDAFERRPTETRLLQGRVCRPQPIRRVPRDCRSTDPVCE